MKPQPVVVTTICSECGLAWEAHGEKPTTSDCIRLLKAELAKRLTPISLVQPWVYPYYQNWWWTSGQNLNAGQTQILNATNNVPNDAITADTATPQIASNTCTAVTA